MRKSRKTCPLSGMRRAGPRDLVSTYGTAALNPEAYSEEQLLTFKYVSRPAGLPAGRGASHPRGRVDARRRGAWNLHTGVPVSHTVDSAPKPRESGAHRRCILPKNVGGAHGTQLRGPVRVGWFKPWSSSTTCPEAAPSASPLRSGCSGSRASPRLLVPALQRACADLPILLSEQLVLLLPDTDHSLAA